MSREHFWPIWLIEHAKVNRDGVRGLNSEYQNPRTITLPLCGDCNHRLGSDLEGPVRQILPEMETGNGINDKEAELLVRWLWKFEGIAACYNHLGFPGWRYSDRWTLIDRVLGNSMARIRGRLILAVGLIHQNDEGLHDWPMGIDSGIGEDAIFVSGVFGRTAIMVVLDRFADVIPGCYGRYALQPEPIEDDDKCFFPPVCFPYAGDAIHVTREASIPLKIAHEDLVRATAANYPVVTRRPRIEIPNL